MSEGFAVVPNWVVDEDTISGPTMLVYLVLSRHVDKDGVCFPSQATIAKKAGISESTVKRALSELRDLGLVEVSVEITDTGRRNTYLLHSSKRGSGHSDPTHQVPVTQEQDPVEQKDYAPTSSPAQPEQLQSTGTSADSPSARRSSRPLVAQWCEARNHHVKHLTTRDVSRFAGAAVSLCKELRTEYGSLAQVPDSAWQRALDTARHWGFYGRFNLVSAYYGSGDHQPALPPSGNYRIYEDGSISTW